MNSNITYSRIIDNGANLCGLTSNALDVNVKSNTFETQSVLIGQSQTAATNQLVAANGSSLNYLTTTFGLTAPRIFYAYLSQSSGTNSIDYTYIDTGGDLVSVTGLVLTFNTYTALAGGVNICMVNSFGMTAGFGITGAEAVYISTTTSAVGRIGSLDANGIYQQSLYMVPNGKKVRIASAMFFGAASANPILIKWTRFGRMLITFNWFSVTNIYHAAGFNGSFGGNYAAGEVIGLGVSNNIGNKQFTLNLVETAA